ncbi:allergen Tha p 1-like [Manduca sexta]|uniref:allergen Tha p 1-like n=1 Tax=Manduca sexta TaxID=7130 RepID=UPI00188F079D|nr:allergen Tha p 1-like [Manduca sexta]
MKTIVVCLFALFAVVLAKPKEFYTDRWDSVDIDSILANRRLLNPYISCILEEGKCTPEGKELKSHIRDAMQTDCAKCTPVQKAATERVIAHLLKHEHESWNKLTAKYDPTGAYTKAHHDQLKSLAA